MTIKANRRIRRKSRALKYAVESSNRKAPYKVLKNKLSAGPREFGPKSPVWDGYMSWAETRDRPYE